MFHALTGRLIYLQRSVVISFHSIMWGIDAENYCLFVGLFSSLVAFNAYFSSNYSYHLQARYVLNKLKSRGHVGNVLLIFLNSIFMEPEAMATCALHLPYVHGW